MLNVKAGIDWHDSYLCSFGRFPLLEEKPSWDSDKEFNYKIGGDVVWGIF
jgi:hypothetical protein